MKINKTRKFLLLFIAIIKSYLITNSQEYKGEVYVVKPYEPTISDAVRLSELPIISDTAKEYKNISYYTINIPFSHEYTPGLIKPAKISDEPLTKLYRVYLKAGFGTNITPFAEIFFNNLRSNKYSTGIRFKHLSSSGQINKPIPTNFSENKISLYGKKFFNTQTLSTDFNFERNSYYKYGYNPDIKPLIELITNKEDFKQRLLSFDFNSNLSSTNAKTDKLSNNIDLNLYSIANIEKNHEIGGKIFADLNKNIKLNNDWKEQKVGITIVTDLSHLDYITNTNYTTILNLKPYLTFNTSLLNIFAGIDIYNSLNKNTNNYFRIFPNAKVKLNLVEDVIKIYANVNGNISKNTMQTLYAENPYSEVDSNLTNSIKNYEINTGIKGNFSSKLSYNVSFNYSETENIPLFVYAPFDNINNLILIHKNTFLVIYDTIKIMNFSSEFFYQKSEKIQLFIKGNYNIYETKNQEKAWHKPNLDITIGSKYNYRDKILVNLDIITYGDHFVKKYINNINTNYEIKKIKGIIDVNISTEYKYNKLISFFVKFYNIAAFRYYRWDNYPSQRFNLLGGLTYSF